VKLSRPALALSAVTLAAVAGIGVIGGVLLEADATPRSLGAAPTVRAVPLTEQSFSDLRSAEVVVRLGVDTRLSAPTGGRVTAFRCSPDEPFVSGESNLRVDGQSVVNLSTRVPLWRDLVRGDKGDDVAAVQEELNRLGHPVVVDGIVGARTLAAVDQLLSRPAGQRPYESSVPASRFLWLPRAETTVTECSTATGAQVEAGGDVAEVAAGPISASVALPTGGPGGARVLVLGDQRVPVGADGRIVDADALAKIAASPLYREARRNSATTFTADLALARPVRVSSVPPAALYAVEGSTACVLAGGTPHRVTVVGSELGVSFVTFPGGGTVPTAVEIAPKDAGSCG